MNAAAFVRRGLWFHRKSCLGVLAGSAFGAMVLLGALMAGDSVKRTLREVAAARLGSVDLVLAGGDRFFRSALADDLSDAAAAPVLMLQATASLQADGRTLAGVQVLGVDERFWKLGPDPDWAVTPVGREFFINRHLADSLGAGVDQALVLRFQKPSVVARDAPLAGGGEDWITLSGGVSGICDDGRFGRFSLEASQLPQATVFVPLERLQQAVDLTGKANLLLLRRRPAHDLDAMRALVARRCTLEDYGLVVEELPLAGALEIRNSRVFHDREVAAVIQRRFPGAQPVITYMANTLAAHDRETPYSMVTAVDAQAAPFLADHPGGVVINEWLAEDLGAGPGDELRIDYYALDSGNRLVERSARFPVAAVIPLDGLAADRMWMPDFPGVAAAENTADWDPGVPIDMDRIRDKDEDYWDVHRGTPRMFLPLETGRTMFGNRWGEFTGLRIPAAAGSKLEVSVKLLDAMTPAVAGLVLADLRGEGLAAAASPVDFAGLFIGMSFFLIVAAVALTAMMFRFHIEQRNRESGLLSAIGIPGRLILRWRMLEGLWVVTLGAIAGAGLAVAYTRGLLALLESVWGGPGGEGLFRFHVAPATLVAGIGGFVLLMLLVIWQVTRRQLRHGAGVRLEAGIEEIDRTPPLRLPVGALGFGLCGLLALGGRLWMGNAGAFFLAGVLWLLAGLAAYRWVLRSRAAASTQVLTARRLAVLNCGRRASRSLVVVGSLACGVFLVVSVAAFRKHRGADWDQRGSGTGGFSYWVETTAAVASNRMLDGTAVVDDPMDLGDARSEFGLIVPLRVGTGDDASCFNLNQVARPRLLATDVAVLAELGAFPIKAVLDGGARTWKILRDGDCLRAFVDEATLQWVLKKKIGDRIIYQDEWGRDFPVEIAGTLGGTVFQGNLVVDQTGFLRRYPSADGPRVFLVDGTGESGAGLDMLRSALGDRGKVITTTGDRLMAFQEVENSYIRIFNLLGGLGVLIGSAGFGLVTARNLRERRHEFAIFHAIGLPGRITREVVMMEARQHIRWGLGIGSVAALLAILPSLVDGDAGMRAFGWIALWIAMIAANAWAFSWLAFHRQIRSATDAGRESGAF
jgi:hypothetical protein